MEEPTSEEPVENGHLEAILAAEAAPEQPKQESEIPADAIKVEPSELTAKPTENKVDFVKLDPDFNLTTKNLERVREELRQEEILQGRKSPFKSETASPVKLETVRH